MPKYSLGESGEARDIIDAFIGFSATREVTNTLRPLLNKFRVRFTSIGRVQTSLLYLIYLREKEVLLEFVDVLGGVILPIDFSLFDYYEKVKIEMRTHLFPLEILGEPKEKKGNDKSLNKEDLILKASMRLLYR